MDDKMLSAQITLIADTLYHIDVALTIILIFLVIAAVIAAAFFLAWLFAHLGGGDDE